MWSPLGPTSVELAVLKHQLGSGGGGGGGESPSPSVGGVPPIALVAAASVGVVGLGFVATKTLRRSNRGKVLGNTFQDGSNSLLVEEPLMPDNLSALKYEHPVDRNEGGELRYADGIDGTSNEH